MLLFFRASGLKIQPPALRVVVDLCLQVDRIMDDLRVDCYSGYRGEETPRRFWLGTRGITVRQVLDRWLAPDHRYFKLLGDDGGEYILRHDPKTHVWEMVFFNQVESP